MEQKCFLRDLQSCIVKRIFVLLPEADYVIDIWSTIVFAEDERVLSSSSIDDHALVEKTSIELYTSQSWESILTKLLYKDLIEVKDFFPKSVPCK